MEQAHGVLGVPCSPVWVGSPLQSAALELLWAQSGEGSQSAPGARWGGHGVLMERRSSCRYVLPLDSQKHQHSAQ